MNIIQSCPTLCDSMDYRVHGVFQARILEWVAFLFSRGIFPPQGRNPGLPRCRQILYQLSHKGRSSLKIRSPCTPEDLDWTKRLCLYWMWKGLHLQVSLDYTLENSYWWKTIWMQWLWENLYSEVSLHCTPECSYWREALCMYWVLKHPELPHDQSDTTHSSLMLFYHW